MGKYDKVIATLNPWKPEVSAYETKVAEVKARASATYGTNPMKMVEAYASMRAKVDQYKEALGVLNLHIEALERLLEESQERRDAGWGLYGAPESTLKMPDGSSLRVERAPQGKVVDREAFRKWLIDNGYESQLRLMPASEQAILKERLSAGEPEPDGMEAFSYAKVVFTKA